MTPDQRLVTALQDAKPSEAAVSLAEMLKAEGMTQVEMFRVFDRVRAQLKDGDPRYDAVLDTMDSIVGWCGPSSKLFDHHLSTEEIASARGE